MHKKDLGIYIHIPFCVQKCLYCDFLSGPSTDDIIEQYVNALCKSIDNLSSEESDNFSPNDYTVRTIYIGGGTPSSINEDYITRILCKVFERFHCAAVEITIEANPGTLNRDKLTSYRSAGINRLSMGLQSANDEELKLLGRIHSYGDFEREFNEAREAGFNNINTDLMIALPGQTQPMLDNSLGRVCALGPEHISAYSLILEEGTYFYDHYKLHPKERELYWHMCDFLTERGYGHYEISNFAMDGYVSRHNSSYWTGIDYLGIGLGASSLINGRRMRCHADMEKYLQAASEFEVDEILDINAMMDEFMILGLRMGKGVTESDFINRFSCSFFDVYKSGIVFLDGEGLVDITNTQRGERGLKLTRRGVDYGNYVFSHFLR